MPATTGGDADARAAALSARIGAEFDRLLDARLAALRLTGAATTVAAPALPADTAAGATGSPREASAAPGAGPACPPPRRRTPGNGHGRWPV